MTRMNEAFFQPGPMSKQPSTSYLGQEAESVVICGGHQASQGGILGIFGRLDFDPKLRERMISPELIILPLDQSATSVSHQLQCTALNSGVKEANHAH